MEPEKYIIQYIVKKTKKMYPNWQDVNELTHAHEKMMLEQHETGDSFDYFQKTATRVRYHRERVGVMVAFAHPDHPDMMAIGYSLCNSSFPSNDRFDQVLVSLPFAYEDAIGFGKTIALGRAADWSGPVSDLTKDYKIPASIKQQFTKFIHRCQRYYKDKVLPAWIETYLASE